MDTNQSCPNCRRGVEKYTSPIPKHLFETNDPPLLQEQASLREILKETEDHLAEIEQTIFRVENLLQGFYHRRDSIKHSLLVNKGVLSSIRRIPREVLCDIFSLIVPPRSKTSLNTSQGLWPLSHVCRIWRDAALSFSSTWCDIQVIHGYGDQQMQPAQWHPHQVLRNLFANTNGRPVRMVLSIGSLSTSSRELLDVAIDHSRQWRDVTITLPTKLISRLRKTHMKLPLLERIVIQHNATCCLTASHIGQALKVAPALRTVVLQDFMGVGNLDLPWSQLTEMCLSGRKSRHDFDLFQFYQRLSNLQTLHLHAPRFPDNYANKALELPHVRSLHLESYYYGALPVLTLPALEELFDVHDRHVPFITDLICRSSCTIKSIGICYGGDLLTIFQLTPNATTLILLSAQISAVSAIVKDPNVLPQLHTLKCSSLDFCDSLAELIDTLQQRPRPLQALTFLHTPMTEVQEQTYAHLSETFGSQMKVSCGEYSSAPFTSSPSVRQLSRIPLQ